MTSPSTPLITFERGVALLVILNLIDAASTHLALHLGFAVELNPLMCWAYTVSPHLFWSLKMGLVLLALWIISRLATEQVARSAVISANILYLLVLVVHLTGWITYFF